MLMDKLPTRTIGQLIEQAAEIYLKAQGLQIVGRNFTCRMSEIDLIGWDASTLVFVEVRYRKSDAYGHPLETVNYNKQRKLVGASQYYLKRFGNHPPAARFDVLSATGERFKLNWEWIQDAFQVQ